MQQAAGLLRRDEGAFLRQLLHAEGAQPPLGRKQGRPQGAVCRFGIAAVIQSLGAVVDGLALEQGLRAGLIREAQQLRGRQRAEDDGLIRPVRDKAPPGGRLRRAAHQQRRALPLPPQDLVHHGLYQIVHGIAPFWLCRVGRRAL